MAVPKLRNEVCKQWQCGGHDFPYGTNQLAFVVKGSNEQTQFQGLFQLVASEGKFWNEDGLGSISVDQRMNTHVINFIKISLKFNSFNEK